MTTMEEAQLSNYQLFKKHYAPYTGHSGFLRFSFPGPSPHFLWALITGLYDVTYSVLAPLGTYES